MNSNTTYSYRPDTVSTREDYERLSEDTMYRHDYLPTKSNKPIDKLVRKINLNIGRGRDGTYSASLRYIVSNVLLAAQKNYYGFRMNVSNNSYDSAVLLGRKGFRTVADALAAQGFLNIIPGRSFQGQSRSGYESEDVRNFSTAFLFTEKLLDLIQDEIDSYSVPKSFVQMKDRETGEQIRVNMKDERFQHVNTILAKMNSISGLGRITYAGVIQRRMDYTAIYSAQRDNGDVQVTGGRIYAKHKFQCFESATRLEKIRIDGCSCTEIDFASMHINLILEQLRAAGHEVDQYRGIDPYVLEGLTLYRYDRLYNECEGIEKPLQRKVIKTIVNTLINCKDQE